MTRFGTSHFVSLQAAIDYYRLYEMDSFSDGVETTAAELERIVKLKLADGEIHIGAPDFGENERLVKVDGGLRYAIEA